METPLSSEMSVIYSRLHHFAFLMAAIFNVKDVFQPIFIFKSYFFFFFCSSSSSSSSSGGGGSRGVMLLLTRSHNGDLIKHVCKFHHVYPYVRS